MQAVCVMLSSNLASNLPIPNALKRLVNTMENIMNDIINSIKEKLSKLSLVDWLLCFAILCPLIGVIMCVIGMISTIVDFSKRKIEESIPYQLEISNLNMKVFNEEILPLEITDEPLRLKLEKEYYFNVDFNITPNKANEGFDHLEIMVCFGQCSLFDYSIEYIDTNDYKIETVGSNSYLSTVIPIPKAKGQTQKFSFNICLVPKEIGEFSATLGFTCETMALTGNTFEGTCISFLGDTYE